MQQGSPKRNPESKAAFEPNQKPAILEFARISKSQVFPSLIAVLDKLLGNEYSIAIRNQFSILLLPAGRFISSRLASHNIRCDSSVFNAQRSTMNKP